MRVRITIGVLLVVVLAFFSQAPVRAGRSITLPHSESFSSATSWQDLKWASQGAVGQHVSGAQVWDGGGAARFWLPTANQGYAGLGQFIFSQATSRLNVRFVYQYGSAYTADDAGAGPKHLIVNRTGSDVRFIAQQHEFAPNQWDLGLGNGISPQYPNPRVWDYGQHANQPIVFEFEAVVGGSYKVWITKRNDPNWNERLLITVPSATGGSWSMVDILGAFGGPAKGGNADPEAWFQISNLVISTTYIGPPAGFLNGSQPPPPPPPQCVFTIQPTSVSLPATASTGSVAVTWSPSDCSPTTWGVTGAPSWMTATATASSVGYAVQSNTLATSRSATLTIAGQPFTVTQAGVSAPPPPPPPPTGCVYAGTTYQPGTVKRLQLTNASFDTTATGLQAAGWELHYVSANTSYVYVIAKCPKP